VSEHLNAIEVFEVARQIERDGASFYRRAAERFRDSQIADLLDQLAAWELEHERIFSDMKRAAEQGGLAVTPAESAEYKAIAALNVFNRELGPAQSLAADVQAADVLNLALKKERDSIHYYQALTRFVVDGRAREQISRIIAEEQRHVEIIAGELKRVHQKSPASGTEKHMNLTDYFARAQGTGILGTADASGRVDLALYVKPHVVDQTTVAFVMRQRLTHQNLKSTMHAAYMFIEEGPQYGGVRLYLTKVREEMNESLAQAIRKKDPRAFPAEDDSGKYIVFFHVDKIRPLVGDSAPASDNQDR